MVIQLTQYSSGEAFVINTFVEGNNNSIVFSCDGEPRVIGDAKICIKGSDNIINFGKDVILNNFSIDIQADQCQIDICDSVRFGGRIIMKISPSNSLVIGEGTTIGGCNFVVGEGGKVVVGKDCMFSWGIEVRNTDSHAILDSEGNRINFARDIDISDHVWIGAKSTILGGVVLGENSVVGIGSVVTGEHVPAVVLAGVPARVVRTGINWSRELLG